jgi:hypothetical protein
MICYFGIHNFYYILSHIVGNVRVAGTFYGVTKVFDHDKNNQWLGVSVDVSPNNDRVAVSYIFFGIMKPANYPMKEVHIFSKY